MDEERDAFRLSAAPAAPGKLSVARALRRSMTPAEARLWAALRGNALRGLHFRRQQVIAGFVVDFYCHPVRLVVEVDGGIHQHTEDYDRERDCVLVTMGLRVFRVSNREVEENLGSVLERIASASEGA